ncbi:Hypothetical predicted protein [Mytilus galloprovincialis]|uniref:Uncharacterized protein n=1 Tax=Mytilus galloprovincialis TaxID=29158 RepID=A0A8B6DD86_MYTGA|nr:Hypothetical predicted protein [Mytilus galloprovincialis]
MSIQKNVVAILLLTLVKSISTIQLEAELFTLAKTMNIKERSSASNGKTLQMTNQDALQYELCIKNPMKLFISLRYSNTENSTHVKVLIDGQQAWSLNASTTSHSFSFVTSDSLDHPILLVDGRYTLTVVIETPEDAAFELDYLELSSHETTKPQDMICMPNRKQVHIEIEDFSDFDVSKIMRRSGASTSRTVLLFQGQTIKYKICIDTTIIIDIQELVYSNDGKSDFIVIKIDDKIIGSFSTMAISSNGRAWNNFKTSGIIGKGIRLDSGVHEVEISVVSADSFGVELDYMTFSVETLLPDKEPLKCVSKKQLEAESFKGGERMRLREASKGYAINLKNGEFLQKNICLRVDTDVTIDKIAYSDRGTSNTLSVYAGATKIVTLSTGTILYSNDSISSTFSTNGPPIVPTLPPGFTSNGGVKKNNITTLTLPENRIKLSKGLHAMSVVVENSDVSGIDLDFLSLTFNFGNNLLQGIECLSHERVLMEAEQFPLESTRGLRFRSNASSNRTVYMKQGDIIKRSVCVTGRVKVSTTTIFFSNDGLADQISIQFQSIPMGTLLTSVDSNNGTGWNDIESKTIDSVLFLREGEYELQVVAANTDKYGIEIDALILDISTFDGSLVPC